MTNETVKNLAALATGVGSGPLSLRLFTMLGVPIGGGPAGDSVAPVAFWLASSSIAQIAAATLFIGGSVVWLAADLGKSRSDRAAGQHFQRTRSRGG